MNVICRSLEISLQIFFYQLQRSLFRNVIASCGEGGLCYCRNDGISFIGSVSIQVFDLIQSKEIYSEQKNFTLERCSIQLNFAMIWNSAKDHWVHYSSTLYNLNNHALHGNESLWLRMMRNTSIFVFSTLCTKQLIDQRSIAQIWLLVKWKISCMLHRESSLK